MLIRRRRIVRGSQVRAGVSARASSWEKASRPAGQGHDQAPDTVLGEPLQGKAVKPGVLGAADAVPWQRARSRWRTSRSASCPTLVLVAKAVGR
ncbi:hypothetical protein ATCC27039_21120 [Actinomyces naeslundii]|nr:hypothetical protein ATCC27039_21120 [Actinomyces naeslundii]